MVVRGSSTRVSPAATPSSKPSVSHAPRSAVTSSSEASCSTGPSPRSSREAISWAPCWSRRAGAARAAGDAGRAQVRHRGGGSRVLLAPCAAAPGDRRLAGRPPTHSERHRTVGVGKTALVDRALQDLGTRVDGVLYFKADAPADGKGSDPAPRGLGGRGADHRSISVPARARGFDGSGWWERLLGDLTTTRFVIVIDDLHHVFDTKIIDPLAAAVRQLAERRRGSRFALISAPDAHGARQTEKRSRTYHRSIRSRSSRTSCRISIRSNLPMLTRFGKTRLIDSFTALGKRPPM